MEHTETSPDSKWFYIGALIVLKLVAIAMLFWCVERHPYYYYKILRWVVTIAAVWNAALGFIIAEDYSTRKKFWYAFGVIFGIIALIFNPIIPFYFPRDVWVNIDVIVGIIFVISLPFAPPKRFFENK